MTSDAEVAVADNAVSNVTPANENATEVDAPNDATNTLTEESLPIASTSASVSVEQNASVDEQKPKSIESELNSELYSDLPDLESESESNNINNGHNDDENSNPNQNHDNNHNNNQNNSNSNDNRNSNTVMKSKKRAKQNANVDRFEDENFIYVSYSGEEQMHLLQELCASNLSEPYSIFTFRYFVNKWPHLCYLAMDKLVADTPCVGLIVGRLRRSKQSPLNAGYIAMLVVDQNQRRKGLGTKLVHLSVEKMISLGADEVVLETEVDNYAALHLYEKLGFVRDWRFRNYYLNGNDAYRLRLYLRPPLPLEKL